ncbi:alpha/beta fold hydrolase [Microbacterium sp. 3J1]|uniref:alpha/beta fold hydrolase n=1 Tax=Microbacterium sp. 3J1 TaxID=861269 RepID=UPI000AAE3E9F|nr:alpha/beta fold hydrolase [Microbacterium sp. 3J1]
MTALFVHRRPGAGRPVVFLHGLASSGDADWPDADWSPLLGDRPSVVVDLPAHGRSSDFGVVTSTEVLDLIAAVVGDGEVDLVGYSLGARLAWDLAGHPSMRVRRLVLGGLAPGEPFAHVDLAAARTALAGGALPADPLTGTILQMASAPGNRADGILDLIEGLAAEPFDPAAAPPVQPTLLVGGIDDGMAAGIHGLAAMLPEGAVRRVPGDHVAALRSQEFRAVTIDFLAG